MSLAPGRSLSRGAALAGLLLAAVVALPAQARTRTFCGVVKKSCGGQLQPICTSGSPCDPGFETYTGKPFPITIDCPWPIADAKVSAGCYDTRPTCNDCSAAGQIPCPPEAEPYCTAGCDAGLEPDPIFGLCEDPGTFKPPVAEANENCAPIVLPCDTGLQCTLALVCSHEPAREGETCDATAPCDSGLFCAAGVPQVCKRRRTVGEGCSAFKPCADGLSCEACFTDKCNAPFQCFPNANQGIITEQQCRTLYSQGMSDAAADLGLATTYSAGDAAAAVASESQSVGVAYGANGEYGCFTSLCAGVSTDASVSAFVSVGFYQDFQSLDPDTFSSVEEVSLPGNLLGYSTSQVFLIDQSLVPYGPPIGTEDAMSIGAGVDLPLSVGGFYCTGPIDPVSVTPGTNDPPPSPLPALEMIVNPDFDDDLEAWICDDGGQCSWVWDAPDPTDRGAGRVASPPEGGPTTSGRLESSCVRVQEGIAYLGAAWARTTGARAGSLDLVWSSSDTCTGDVVGSDLIDVSPPDGVWRRLSRPVMAPPGARTVRLTAEASRDPETDSPSETTIDSAYVPEPDAVAAALAAAAALAGLARGGRAPRRAGMMSPCEGARLRRPRGVPGRPGHGAEGNR